jgi:hypothetical protein
MVMADVESGWLTVDKAKDVYGVIFLKDDRRAGLRIDQQATAAKRAELSRCPVKRGYDFGEVHPFGESIKIEIQTKVA